MLFLPFTFNNLQSEDLELETQIELCNVNFKVVKEVSKHICFLSNARI